VDFYHPYFDIRLVTFALALPPLPWCMDKILLRQTGKNLLPQPVLERPKAPWVEDPVPKMIRRSEARGLDKFSPAPPLSDFVNWRAIFPLTSENTSLKLWMNLRPMSLNYFLRAS
jgi:asparagine synthase (glutamine-hydrolysing)